MPGKMPGFFIEACSMGEGQECTDASDAKTFYTKDHHRKAMKTTVTGSPKHMDSSEVHSA